MALTPAAFLAVSSVLLCRELLNAAEVPARTAAVPAGGSAAA
jgi:hypothetical protein